MSSMKNQKTKRSFKGSGGKFDYVDPVDDVMRNGRQATMANLHQMKFHEMKVEREPFTNQNDRKGGGASNNL